MVERDSLKPVEWIGSSRKGLRECPQDVRDDIGYALYVVQRGGFPAGASPLKGSLRGITEIRADDDDSTYRAMYTVQFVGVVYVLHVFQKKSTSGVATPKHELDLIRARLVTARKHYAEHYAGRASG